MQMWTTLLANGAAQLQPTGPAKIVDGVNNYVFSLAEVRSDTGMRLVVPKTLIVPNRNASKSVIAVARQIRELLERN
jgi:hypothetical protein